MSLENLGRLAGFAPALAVCILLASAPRPSIAQAANSAGTGTTFAIVDTNQTLCYGIEANFELRS